MTRNFESFFGGSPEVTAEAPGRVNLIGEHTDYNGGFVLPVSIPQKTKCELAKRSDDLVRVASVSVEDTQTSEYKLGEEKKQEKWWDYIQGITFVVRDFFTITGFDVRFETTVPLGSGLASSAALEISLLRALREAYKLELDELQMARLGRTSENTFVGAKVGIMDQMAAALGKQGSALFIDTLSLEYQYIPLPSGCSLAAIHSGIEHEHRSGSYNLRRMECEKACRLLGIAQLRDFKIQDLRKLEQIPDPYRKRARHVITENQRVLDAVQAMKDGKLSELGKLLYESHESLRNDYEVSTPEIDLLVEYAQSEPRIFGARLTGGGFGGSVLFVLEPGNEQLLSDIADRYQRKTGLSPQIFVL